MALVLYVCRQPPLHEVRCPTRKANVDAIITYACTVAMPDTRPWHARMRRQLSRFHDTTRPPRRSKSRIARVLARRRKTPKPYRLRRGSPRLAYPSLSHLEYTRRHSAQAFRESRSSPDTTASYPAHHYSHPRYSIQASSHRPVGYRSHRVLYRRTRLNESHRSSPNLS